MLNKAVVREAIIARLDNVKAWQLAAIYNGLAEETVLDMNERTGEIQMADGSALTAATLFEILNVPLEEEENENEG